MEDVKANWIDISMPIRDGMPHWPGDPEVRVERTATLERDGVNLTMLAMCAHTGTHMDAPLHFVDGGAAIDTLPPEAANGPARVIDLASGDAFDCRPGERLLFKSGARKALTEAVADRLAAAGVLLAGIDSLSIGPGGEAGRRIHRTLLGAGIWLLEGLELDAVEPGQYELLCLPLRIAGADGAPARAFLRRLE